MVNSLMIYGGAFFISVLISYLYSFTNKYSEISKFVWTVLIILPVSLLASLRSTSVGTDSLTYSILYDSWLKLVNIPQYTLSYLTGYSDWIEPGYTFLNRLSFLIYDDVRTIFFVSSFVQMFFIWRGIENFKEYLNPSFSLLTYYLFAFNTSLNLMRQAIAVSIVFYAFKYIVSNKFMKYFFFIILASTFHVSAILFLVLYVFRIFLKDSTGSSITLYYIGLAGSPAILYGLVLIADNIGLISKLGFDIYGFNFSNFGLGFLLYILPIIIPLAVFEREMMYKIPNRSYNILFYISLLQIPLRFLTYYSTYSGRLEEFVSITQVLLVSMLITNVDKSNKIILSAYFLLWYILYHILTFYLGNANETYPYFFS